MSTDAIRTAFEALGSRDVERLVALMHPKMEWRGSADVAALATASDLTRSRGGP